MEGESSRQRLPRGGDLTVMRLLDLDRWAWPRAPWSRGPEFVLSSAPIRVEQTCDAPTAKAEGLEVAPHAPSPVGPETSTSNKMHSDGRFPKAKTARRAMGKVLEPERSRPGMSLIRESSIRAPLVDDEQHRSLSLPSLG